MNNKHWWNKEVTWGMLIKIMIAINIICLINCYHIAYIGDLIDKREMEYYNYLKKQVKLQEELLNLYRRK